MRAKKFRAVLSGVVLASSVALVLYTTVSKGAQAYATVDEVMVNPSEWYGKTMQLHGFVVDNSIEQRTSGAHEYRFKIKTGEHAVTATYAGIVPDTFKDGAELVLTGKLDANGFHATNMTAKCPSKYEAAGPPPPTVR
jgi:cytochrome c-type biogenesis protein CcmE